MARFTFAGYPAPFVYEKPDGKKKVKHLLWGDWLKFTGEAPRDDWVHVYARGRTGWMRREDVVEADLKPLEVCFVDIGQGDGCFIVSPEDKLIVIDAGESDNMFRFLSWRFNLLNNPDVQIPPFDVTIISHPDSDHYAGIKYLFDCERFTFTTVYHNGIVERSGEETLGPRVKVGKLQYLTDLAPDLKSLKRIVNDPARVGRKLYPTLLRDALATRRVKDVRMLSSNDKHVPGYGPGQPLELQVLAPVTEKVEGKQCLRWFGDNGKTKNGHSVVLRARVGDVTILLGGDLNIPSEEYLLHHYTGGRFDTKTADGREKLVEASRGVFESDVAKACHHGSSDFTDLFLRAVNPLAMAISSGDDEPHAHPRPDALGGFGKCGRGDRPLLFSTELGRSSRENIKRPEALRQRFRDLIVARDGARDAAAKAAVEKQIEAVLAQLERSVAVYGLINLRTDGKRVLMAQKLEQEAARGSWDLHRLEPDDQGRLRYASKHAEGH